jgi:ketosteroid isomerase-like protein
MPTTPEGALQAFFQAFNQGDIEALMALYEPQPVLVAQPGGGSRRGKPPYGKP